MGYIEAELSAKDIPELKGLPCIFFIVPEKIYNARTPILIGTNILKELANTCKELHGEQYLQKAPLTTSWYLALRCITLREKEPKKNKDRLAIIRSTETSKVT